MIAKKCGKWYHFIADIYLKETNRAGRTETSSFPPNGKKGKETGEKKKGSNV